MVSSFGRTDIRRALPNSWASFGTYTSAAKMMHLRGSIVEYFYEPGGPRAYKCGYCKSPDTSRLQGLMAYKMTCQDYQTLVDRGFQRSGKFVYRPVMDRTCCPQYVIRTDVRKFRPSKSQRAVLKKLHKYLLHGRELTQTSGSSSGAAMTEEAMVESTSAATNSMDEATTSMDEQPLVKKPGLKKKLAVRPGIGPDPSKPPCRKAKVVRRERKAQKQAAKQLQMETGSSKPLPNCDQEKVPSDLVTNSPMITTEDTKHPVASTEPSGSDKLFAFPLEDLLTVPVATNYAHRFESRLVPCNIRSSEFQSTYQESYSVFKKFQMGVHKEKEEDCQERHFEEFIVDSPLIFEDGCEGMPCGYGSYHQQYLLDGKIFAVGVLDILPKGVLCEYLYYDPEYRFIAPGVYTALQEIAFTQQFYRHNPAMQYYYMGFYVQSCPKMNYKRKYSASYLLCPETHQYISLEECVPKLLVSEYSRLADNDTPNVIGQFSDSDLNDLPVFTMDMMKMSYGAYKTMYGDRSQELVEEYAELIGLEVASRTKLLLGRMF